MNLTRTRKAVAAYDALVALPMPDDFGQAWARLKAEDAAGEAVGVAYGEDTKDRNNPEVCRACIRPGKANPAHPDDLSFVRRMVRDYP